MGSKGSPRIFTFEEARDLLPVVRRKTAEAMERIAALQLAESDEEDDDEDAEESARRQAARILGEWAAEIQGLGIEVKGPWLVDFDSGAGYYCWKWPEESLEFFHGYEDGFAGRMRIQ